MKNLDWTSIATGLVAGVTAALLSLSANVQSVLSIVLFAASALPILIAGQWVDTNSLLPTRYATVSTEINNPANMLKGLRVSTDGTVPIGAFVEVYAEVILDPDSAQTADLRPFGGAVANADTSGATLAELETEVNELKAVLRQIGAIGP